MAYDKRKSRRIGNVLKKIYGDITHPASFSSPRRLWLAGRDVLPSLTLEEVRYWLSGEKTYTLHRRVVTRFKRRKVIARGIDHQWQADLMEMGAIAKENRGNKYLLATIDVFSRYASVRAIKNKQTATVTKAFLDIIKKGRRKPIKLQTDHGKEFLSNEFMQMLKTNKIIWVETHQDVKAQMVERFNRTFKGLLHKYFTEKVTLRYVHRLQDFVNTYNSRPHRGLSGHVPRDVTKKNEDLMYHIQYNDYLKPEPKKHKFQVNDKVRLSVYRKTFKRGYERNFTNHIFTIVNQLMTNPPTYHVKDEDGEFIQGALYEQEMVRVTQREF